MFRYWKSRTLLIIFFLIAMATAQADETCKRPGLVWDAWRDQVLAANPGTDFFELRGDGRDEILRAYNCHQSTEKCPPDQLMVFHCMGNRKVLLAFVKEGCVTLAEDILIEDYRRLVIGGEPC